MKELDLFGGESGASAGGADGSRGGGDAEEAAAAPLAARMRPRGLDEFAGQQQLLGPGRALREMIERGTAGSLILWGPPGTGKTTLARLIAQRSGAVFIEFSAVTEGVARVREIIAQARERLRATGRRTLLFCDEIHRFNKAQQDAFLPHVEAGAIWLVGATTENPGFEVIGALLSRTRVFVLEPLGVADLLAILRRALTDEARGLGALGLDVDDEALTLIAHLADGDARRALNALEAAASIAGPDALVSAPLAREAFQQRIAHADKGGDLHFDLLSAYHKSLRGSDPDGALYWMARFIEGGGDPLILFRRATAMAAEDVGLADPGALRLAVAAREAYRGLGPPEGYLPLAELTIYLATAPKSNSAYRALQAALEAARETPAERVPLHLRNAPTALARELGHGAGYRYAHDEQNAYAAQEYLPAALRAARFYEPGPRGIEPRIAARLAEWARLKAEARSRTGTGADADGAVDAP